MTKKDLVKWLNQKAEESKELAAENRKRLINEVEEAAYDLVGLDAFVEKIVGMYSEVLTEYEKFMEHTNSIEGIRFSPFYYRTGYNDLVGNLTSRTKFREIMTAAIGVNTEAYRKVTKSTAGDVAKVTQTYETVIQTVKNLPTAKDGLEYLKKLGFNISEIVPAKPEKQLPATTDVNVDVRYLLLQDSKKSGDQEETATETTSRSLELMNSINKLIDQGQNKGEVDCAYCGGKVHYVYANPMSMRAKCDSCGFSMIS